MKLLIVTQAVDADDPVLGFFIRWIEELAKRFEHIEVIALTVGKYALPANVRVHSLGKERGRPLLGAFAYAIRFKWLAWRLRGEYDAVFVHMNQEYVLIAGAFWRLAHKRVALWRNHPYGDPFTYIAAALADTVLATSPDSFVARFKKTRLMPVGIDTELFAPAARAGGSDWVGTRILSLGRIAPIKNIHALIKALSALHAEGVAFSADIYGDALPRDAAYAREARALGGELVAAGALAFHGAVPHRQTPSIYAAHDLFVNLTPSGSFDKTILEAMASGLTILTSNRALAEVISAGDLVREDAADLAAKLRRALTLSPEERGTCAQRGRIYVEQHHSLALLAEKISQIFS